MSTTNSKFVVGVIGTQNTGKSTFIKDLLERLKGTPMEFKTVGCDYREKIRQAGLKINRDGNLECQKIIFDTLVEQLDVIDGMPSGNYITDRSPMDAYVYTEYLFRHRPELGIRQSDMDEMFDRLQQNMDRYDRIVFLDLDKCANVEVVDDKFRDTNLEYRKEIDQIFKEVIGRLGTAYLWGKLSTDIQGTRENRVERFLEMESGSFIVENGVESSVKWGAT